MNLPLGASGDAVVARSRPAAPLRLEEGANYSLEQFAALVGMTSEEVRQRIYKKRIPAVRGFKRGQWLIPAELVQERLDGRVAAFRGVPDEPPR